MPIHPAVLQRRHWGDGRIRIGVKTSNSNGKTYPKKLSTFRFTSPSREMIAGAAELYGGEVQPWKSPEGEQFEVITTATRIPVVLPPNPLTQGMEAWNGAMCVRRCDGRTREILSGKPCICAAEDDRICKPTTRLSVLLRDVPSLGTWRLDSHGWNAAAELPDAAEFLAHAGRYVDGVLFLRERRGTANGKPTSYMVPGLTVEGITPAQLLSGNLPDRQAVAGRTAAAITAGGPAEPPDYLAQARAATAAAQVGEVWRAARDAGHLSDNLRAELNTLGETLRRREAAASASADQTDHLRQQILACWRGTTSELHAAFAGATGTTMKHATVAQLTAFLSAVSPPDGDVGEVVDAEIVEDEPDAIMRAAAAMQTDTSGDWPPVVKPGEGGGQ